jgi:hypothetical protein
MPASRSTGRPACSPPAPFRRPSQPPLAPVAISLPLVNGAIRKALEAHGIGGDVIEDVTDQVIEASGVEVPGEES